MSRWTAKADSSTNIIMWVGGIIAVLIMVIWYAKNLYPTHTAVDIIESDLLNIQQSVNQACMSVSYKHEYNPITETGVFAADHSRICINTTMVAACREVFCNVSGPVNISLDEISTFLIEKNDTVRIH